MDEFLTRIEEAITRGRGFAESLMQDHLRVWRASTEPPTEGEWGQVIPAPPVLVYEGPGKATNDRTYPSQPNIGGGNGSASAVAQITAMVSHVHFPHGTTQVRTNDIVEWVSSVNPRLTGRRVRITVDQDKTWNTSVRCNVTEVVE